MPVGGAYTGSMGIPTRLIEFLDRENVRYEVLHHPVAYTAQELSAIEGVKGHEHAKVVMVKTGGKLVMAVLPSDRRLDLGRLPAGELAMEADFKGVFPDCETGTMPPFGRLWDLETWVDRSFTQNVRIVFEAGTHCDAIKMSYADFERLVRPKIVECAVKRP